MLTIVFLWQRIVIEKNEFTKVQALADSYDAAFTLSSIDLTKKIDADRAKILQSGIKNMASLLVMCTFGVPEAKAAAGKVALLSHIIRKDFRSLHLNDLRFDPTKQTDLAAAKLLAPLDHLMKLRGVSLEVFHYWLKTQEVM